jgi:hypothetical protein
MTAVLPDETVDLAVVPAGHPSTNLAFSRPWQGWPVGDPRKLALARAEADVYDGDLDDMAYGPQDEPAGWEP